MREIVLDTETTGLNPAEGHRIVEIGCVEIVNNIPTGRTWHSLLNPQRRVPKDASKIHGLTTAKLRDAPLFKERVAGLFAFLGDAKLIAHNAPFDAAFLNAELALIGKPSIEAQRWFCTLALARRKRPGKRNSLDALCKDFGISTVGREKHGALTDARLLSEVYTRLTDRSQAELFLAPAGEAGQAATPALRRKRPLAPRLSPEEAAAHAAFVESLGPNAIWRRYEEAAPLERAA
ncbi:MAG: DNA polymerase III subunit epsilon [Rhodomicrobium sp.]